MAGTERRPTRWLSRSLNLAAAVLGCLVLARFLRSMGVDALERTLRQPAWAIALLLFLGLAVLGCDAIALHLLLRPEARTVSFLRVLGAQVAGAALNLLTPGGKLGEATKITLLTGHAPHNRVLTSVLLFNLLYFYVAVGTVVLTLPLAHAALELPSELLVAAWVVAVLGLLSVVFVARLAGRAPVARCLAALGRWRVVAAPTQARWASHVERLDSHLRELDGATSPGTRWAVLFIVAAKLLGWIELAIILHVLGIEPTPVTMIALLSLGTLGDHVSKLAPLGVGFADGAHYVLFGVLGLAPRSGVLMALLRRAQHAVFAVLGLAILLVLVVGENVAAARRHARVAGLRERYPG